MGFFFVETKSTDKNLHGLNPDFLRRHGCNVCPLNDAKNLEHSRMDPNGSTKPTILFVGTSPTEFEDKQGEHFSGKYTHLVTKFIPDEYKSKIRYTSSLNCRKSGKPESVELNCCYPRLVADIEKTKPKVIFGFGHAPLFQIVNPDSKHRLISLWAGRKLPVKIGNHTCWYYSFDHPLEIIQDRLYGKRPSGGFKSEDEFVLSVDLKRAFEEINNLPEPIVHTVESASDGIELVDDIHRVADLLDEASWQATAGVDIETNCLRPYEANAKILTIGVSTKAGTFAFAVDHPEAPWTELERRQLDVLIKRFLYESKCRKTVHNLAFELEWFGVKYGTGCFYSSPWECSLSQAYILDARRGGLSLDFLSFIYFGLRLKDISSLDRANLEKAPLIDVLKYQGIDARYHRLLYLKQVKQIEQRGLDAVYDAQIRRIFALVAVQIKGVPVDQAVVKKLRKKYEGRVKEIEADIAKTDIVTEFENKKGTKFNPGSVTDVNYLMKNILGEEIESSDKTELGHVKHPLAKKIVQYREATKVLSTYITIVDESEKDNVVFPDGLMHPIISTTTVVSWRTSSDSPNIQNWPKRDEERKEVRAQIRCPDRNMRIVSIDYAGIQARNVAMESRDKKLVEAFWHNYDIHSDWRERIYKKYPSWIPKDKLKDKEAMKHYRYLAKNKFVFATFFGAQSFTTSEGLGIPRDICEDLRLEFFDEFPDIKKWHDSLDKMYYKNGYITGLSGFHCRAPISPNQRINLPIQGDESAIVLDALSRLAEMEDPRYLPMLEVHDDLTFRMPKDQIEKRLEVIVKTLVTVPFDWANVVPIEVEVSVGEDWIHMEEIGKYSNDKWDGIIQIKE